MLCVSYSVKHCCPVSSVHISNVCSPVDVTCKVGYLVQIAAAAGTFDCAALLVAILYVLSSFPFVVLSWRRSIPRETNETLDRLEDVIDFYQWSTGL